MYILDDSNKKEITQKKNESTKNKNNTKQKNLEKPQSGMTLEEIIMYCNVTKKRLTELQQKIENHNQTHHMTKINFRLKRITKNQNKNSNGTNLQQLENQLNHLNDNITMVDKLIKD